MNIKLHDLQDLPLRPRQWPIGLRGSSICSATRHGHSGSQDTGSDFSYSMLLPVRCWAIGQPRTPLQGWKSLKCRTSEAGSGVPRPVTRLDLSHPGHPSATGSCRRAKKQKTSGSLQDGSRWVQRKKGKGLIWQGWLGWEWGEFGLMTVGLGLFAVIAGSTEGLSMEIRQQINRQRPSPRLPMVDPDEKRQSMVLRHLLSWWKVE